MNRFDLEQLRRQEPYYRANAETSRQLGGKVLTMLLGPSGVGKSTVLNQVLEFQAAQTYSTWGEPGSLLTRNRKRYDPLITQTADEGVTPGDVVARIRNRMLANYSIHPSGEIYATGPEGFVYDFNLLPTLPRSVGQLRHAGFKATHTVFITAEPHDFKAGLHERESDPSYKKRLEEGIENIEYALDNADDIHFVRNSHAPGGREMAADDVIAVTGGEYDRDKTPELHVASAMHKYLRECLEA